MTGEWPLLAYMYHLEDGEWIWSGAIRSVEHGKAWIAKQEDPENWKVEPKYETDTEEN